MSHEDHLQIGLVRRAHGARGELRVEPTTDQPERRFAPEAELFVGGRAYVVESSRPQPDGSWLVRLVGLTSKSEADRLRGGEVSIQREGTELMRDDLVGFEVHSRDAIVGTVEAVENTGSNDILVVSRQDPPGGKLLIPLVRDLGVTLDVAERRVLIEDLNRLI